MHQYIFSIGPRDYFNRPRRFRRNRQRSSFTGISRFFWRRYSSKFKFQKSPLPWFLDFATPWSALEDVPKRCGHFSLRGQPVAWVEISESIFARFERILQQQSSKCPSGCWRFPFEVQWQKEETKGQKLLTKTVITPDAWLVARNIKKIPRQIAKKIPFDLITPFGPKTRPLEQKTPGRRNSNRKSVQLASASFETRRTGLHTQILP